MVFFFFCEIKKKKKQKRNKCLLTSWNDRWLFDHCRSSLFVIRIVSRMNHWIFVFVVLILKERKIRDMKIKYEEKNCFFYLPLMVVEREC